MSSAELAGPVDGPKRRARTLACLQVVAGILLFLALDRAVFGTGLYLRYVAPASGVASMARAMDAVHHVPPGRRTVLVFGDSRIGEGFSAPIADREAAQAGSALVFTNDSVASSLPRVWFYMLRRLLRQGPPLAAVAIMLPSYHDDDIEPQAARRGDIVFLHPLLRLRDLSDFPFSFPARAEREEAADAILFKGMFFKTDVLDLLRDPAKRLTETRAWRANGFDWISNYPGRPASLEGLALDMGDGRLTVAEGHGAPDPATLAGYARLLFANKGRPPENAAAAAYRAEWLGRLAVLCRQAGVPLVVFRIPRGPLHSLATPDPDPTGAVGALAARGDITLLPADSFGTLERPEYFFDDLHLNHAGRDRFSAMLARAVTAHLAPAPTPAK